MQKKLVYILGLISILAVFLLQSKSTNFRPGHRGWVAAHCLAIADKATPENNFLGHTCSFESNNKRDFYYFDRYPVLFTAISNQVLSLTDDLNAKVYLSRQWMNLIYVTTFILAFLLIRLMLFDNILSLALTLFIAGGFYYVKYKDMFHFDQPALLGLISFLYVLKLRQLKKISLKVMIPIIVIGALSGRGYATCLAVAFWFGLDSLWELKTSGFKQFIKSFYKRDSFITVFTVFIFASSALFYNVYTEAEKRSVPLGKTSIVGTAKHRTGLTNAYSFPWPSFIKGQASRIMKGSFPFVVNASRKNKTFVGGKKLFKESIILKSMLIISITIYIGLLVLVVKHNRKSELKSRIKNFFDRTNIVIFMSGFAWLFPMKRLAGPHHYTTMYYIGFYIVIGVILLGVVKQEKFKKVVLASCFSLFIISLLSAKMFYDTEETSAANYTKDFAEIKTQLNKHGAETVQLFKGYRKFVEGSPYALCFYLGERYISDNSKWFISDKKQTGDYKNHTENNSNYFLYEKL